MVFLDTILDIVFPAKCLGCGKSGTELCCACLNDAPNAERESAKWIFPIYDYRHPIVKKSLWLLKYSGKRRLAIIFAENIYDKILEELSELNLMENFVEPILIPIPLSKDRYRERGFNQSQLICEELTKINNLRHGVDLKLEKNILIKIKETEHQARIKDRNIRLKNLVGSFAIKNTQNVEFLKGKNIILIDDITTTGATLNEARRILKKFGARKVIAFTVAH
jgi:competence protein ComFC